MARYAAFFSYTPEAWNQMVSKPTDRTEAVRQLASAAGGRVESFYFMFGDRDGFVVLDVPDTASAAAVSIAVSSTGSFTHMETRQLIAPEDLPSVLEQAGNLRQSYRPPGQ